MKIETSNVQDQPKVVIQGGKNPFDEALPNAVENTVGKILRPTAKKPDNFGYSGATCEHSCSCHSTVQHNCRLIQRGQLAY